MVKKKIEEGFIEISKDEAFEEIENGLIEVYGVDPDGSTTLLLTIKTAKLYDRFAVERID